MQNQSRKHTPVSRWQIFGIRPTPATSIVLLLLAASILLVGMGVVALVLAPLVILAGASLCLFAIALVCLISVVKMCVALLRWLAQRFRQSSWYSSLRPFVSLLQVRLAYLLLNWLAGWLSEHDPTPRPPGQYSTYAWRMRALKET